MTADERAGQLVRDHLGDSVVFGREQQCFIASIAQALREARAGGLEKAAEIADYHANLPMRNAAAKAQSRDIKISCLATAGRIRRGEYEDPTSTVMSGEGDSAK